MQGVNNLIEIVKGCETAYKIAGIRKAKELILEKSHIMTKAFEQILYLNITKDKNWIHQTKAMKKLGFEQPVLAAMYMISQLEEMDYKKLDMAFRTPVFTEDKLEVIPSYNFDKQVLNLDIGIVSKEKIIPAYNVTLSNIVSNWKKTESIIPEKDIIKQSESYSIDSIAIGLISGYMWTAMQKMQGPGIKKKFQDIIERKEPEYNKEKSKLENIKNNEGKDSDNYNNQKIILEQINEKLLPAKRKLKFIKGTNEAFEKGLFPMYSKIILEKYKKIDENYELEYSLNPLNMRIRGDNGTGKTSVIIKQNNKAVMQATFSLTYVTKEDLLKNLRQ